MCPLILITESQFAIGLSILSFGFSFLVFRQANRQFKALNQSYLHGDMYFDFVKPDLKPGEVINDNTKLTGMYIFIDLQNVGNLPLQFEAKKFSIIINSKSFNTLTETSNKMGVIYPKQSVQFRSSVVYFKDEQTPLKFSEIRKFDLQGEVLFDYHDIGSSHIKSYDRALKYTFDHIQLTSRYLNINDRI